MQDQFNAFHFIHKLSSFRDYLPQAKLVPFPALRLDNQIIQLQMTSQTCLVSQIKVNRACVPSKVRVIETLKGWQMVILRRAR